MLTAINNLVFNKLWITTVGTFGFIEINTPIIATEKCAGSDKTLRECLLEKESVGEGKKLKLFIGI